MLAKTVEVGGKDWDQRLPYVLFAYRASTPFFLLYGRDPRLPTDSLMCLPKAKKLVGLQEYGWGLAVKMSEAWDLARTCVGLAYMASTLESPFFLLYGRDPRLPTDSLMCLPKAKKLVGLQEYGRGLAVKMSEAWDLARTCVGHAQRRQKQCYRQPFKWVIECSFLNLLRRQETLPISLHDHFMARFKWIHCQDSSS